MLKRHSQTTNFEDPHTTDTGELSEIQGFSQPVQVAFREKKLGSRGVCVQKQTHLRLVHTHNYLTNNEQGQSTIVGSCLDVPR